MPPWRPTGLPATPIPPAPQATSVQLTALRLLHYRPPRAATHAGAHASRCPRAHAAPGARRPLATEPPRAAARPLPPARHARRRGGRARRPGPPLDARALRRRRVGHRRGERPPRRLDHARPRPALALGRGHAALDRPARPARGAARHRARARAARRGAGALLSAAGGGQCPPTRRLAPRAARPRRDAERRLRRRARGRRRLPARAADRSLAPAEHPRGRARQRPGPHRDRTPGPAAGGEPPLRAARPARRGRRGALAPARRAPGAHPAAALGRGSRARRARAFRAAARRACARAGRRPGSSRRRRGAAPRARRPPRPRRRAAARRARPQDERAARLRSGRARGVRPPGHGGAAVTPAVAEAAIRDFQESFAAVRQEIGRVVVGHEHAIDVILTAFFAGGHVLIEGVPGIGKTLIVRSLAEALNLTFNRVQFTVDLMPADITGTRVINEGADGRREFVFVPGPVFAHILLADEINRATPKTQAALLEAMAEQQVTVAGTSYPLAPPFFVLATLNPIEMEGTYQLPEAQLDRFLFKILLDYPSGAELERILGETTAAELPAVRPVLPRETAARRVEELKHLVRQVLVAPHMERHVAALVRATVPASGELPQAMARYVSYGSSPRGGQALLLGAKVMALLAGRPHITFEDVERVALPALRHRLVMTYLAEAAGVDAAQVVEGVLASARRARA